jgi:hypothetical protein
MVKDLSTEHLPPAPACKCSVERRSGVGALLKAPLRTSSAQSGARQVAEIIEQLGMQPHPEGGWYKETFRDAAQVTLLTLLSATPRSLLLDAGSVWSMLPQHEASHAVASCASTKSRKAVSPAQTIHPGFAAGERAVSLHCHLLSSARRR